MPTSGILQELLPIARHSPSIIVPFSDFTTPPDISISFTAVPYVPLRVGGVSISSDACSILKSNSQ